jgi:hypothetical protein
LAVALLAGVPCVTGCVAEVQPEPAYVVTETDQVPPTIVESPMVVYEGQPVYLYRDRWYFRHGNHWDYYRSNAEPPALRQRRYVQAAPPVRTYSAPPAVRLR